jgi:phosphatidylinositol glycan class S
VEAPHLSDPENLLKSVQHALDDANDFSAHHLRLRLATPKAKAGEEEIERNTAATLRLLPGAGSAHTYVFFPAGVYAIS